MGWDLAHMGTDPLGRAALCSWHHALCGSQLQALDGWITKEQYARVRRCAD